MKDRDRFCTKCSAKTHTGMETSLNQRLFFCCSLLLEEYLNSPGLHYKYLSNFPQNMYIPLWLENKFKFMLFRLMGNAFMSQSIESRQF